MSVGVCPYDLFEFLNNDPGDVFPIKGNPAHDVGLLRLRTPSGAECGE